MLGGALLIEPTPLIAPGMALPTVGGFWPALPVPGGPGYPGLPPPPGLPPVPGAPGWGWLPEPPLPELPLPDRALAPARVGACSGRPVYALTLSSAL